MDICFTAGSRKAPGQKPAPEQTQDASRHIFKAPEDLPRGHKCATEIFCKVQILLGVFFPPLPITPQYSRGPGSRLHQAGLGTKTPSVFLKLLPSKTRPLPSTPSLQMQACSNRQLPVDTDDTDYQGLSIAILKHLQCHRKGWGGDMNSPSTRSEFMLH